MALDATTRTRRARALWGYSLLHQDKLAERAGIHKDRLRAILQFNPRKPATPEELRALARAAGVNEERAISEDLAESSAPDAEVARMLTRLADVEQILFQAVKPRTAGLDPAETDAALQRLESLLRSREGARPPESLEAPGDH